MKYLLLIYGNPKNWEHPLFLRDPRFLALPAAERDELTRRADALHREIIESGELVVGVALADPARARTVRVRGGTPVTTDGPYVEAKEQLAGYLVVDCDDPRRAAEIAASIPDARFAAVEVRPIVDVPGEDQRGTRGR
ncbi:YciI family protein [Nonomuraea sp. K274]|uniref:YciI family protein n=1 Tax=Nonomuraea cypriaca TaxID=1187855 RepID=A0A931EY94_9ACTN|nr:YciI family protein [Nonomuraea cypriaca]MBF8184986.1 YciI family protein [Nonomuraea cypriaca]